MKLPTDHATRDLLDSLRALNQKPGKDHAFARGYPKLIDAIEHWLLDAIHRDRTGSVIPDGYPVSTGGGRSGCSLAIVVKDENGHHERVPVTGVEAAAIALADGHIPRDHHHELTIRGAGALEDAVVALNTLVSALASIDDQTRTDGPGTKTCGHCTEKRGQGADRPVHATGTVNDRLERSIALCKHCYGFVERTAKPGTHAGHLPTDEQIRHHEEHGRWRLRVA